MKTLSAIIIAKNEGHNIVDCIASVAFANEVIVIDDNSEDNTAALAKAAGAIVYTRAMNGDFAGQQNYAITQATSDWLLFIDCDERITPQLANEIENVINTGTLAAYRIRRLNHFAKQRVRFGTLRSDTVTRLLPREGAIFEGLVHQKLIHQYPEKRLKQPMLHYTYASWTQYYAKFEQYTRLSAEKYLAEGKSFSFIRDILCRPLWAFLKMYIIHGGFLDGRIGWILAANHYHYTQVKYIRFYALKKQGREAL